MIDHETDPEVIAATAARIADLARRDLDTIYTAREATSLAHVHAACDVSQALAAAAEAIAEGNPGRDVEGCTDCETDADHDEYPLRPIEETTEPLYARPLKPDASYAEALAAAAADVAIAARRNLDDLALIDHERLTLADELALVRATADVSRALADASEAVAYADLCRWCGGDLSDRPDPPASEAACASRHALDHEPEKDDGSTTSTVVAMPRTFDPDHDQYPLPSSEESPSPADSPSPFVRCLAVPSGVTGVRCTRIAGHPGEHQSSTNTGGLVRWDRNGMRSS